MNSLQTALDSIGEQNDALAMWMVKIPIKTVSESNLQEHWSKKSARHKLQQWQIKTEWLKTNPEIKLPCHILLTRIAPRQLDSDNLQMAFKWTRDMLAKLITNDSRPLGFADSDHRITWAYEQKKGNPLEYAIEIKITPAA